MLKQFERLVKETRPTLVTMENVPQVQKHAVFRSFVRMLEAADYWVRTGIVSCVDYGIPQARTRLVLLASKLGPVALRPRDGRRDRARTVRQTIGRMERLKAGQTSEIDPLHRASALSVLNSKRIREASPGGSWRDWDAKLVATCHRNETGRSFPGVYGRMEWDKPSPTITTQFYGFGSGRFGHPQQHRALSLREGSLLQTFPPNYEFVRGEAQVHFATVGRLIGNAVPVRLGEVIGESLLEHVDELGQGQRLNRAAEKVTPRRR
jgi:DNA (cytosine-5)-methyltransferase 1